MSQPIILAVDEDQAIAWALARDLEKRFSPDYDIIVEPSPSTALDRLRQLRDEGTEVALVIAGLWMEEQTGTQSSSTPMRSIPRRAACSWCPSVTRARMRNSSGR